MFRYLILLTVLALGCSEKTVAPQDESGTISMFLYVKKDSLTTLSGTQANVFLSFDSFHQYRFLVDETSGTLYNLQGNFDIQQLDPADPFSYAIVFKDIPIGTHSLSIALEKGSNYRTKYSQQISVETNKNTSLGLVGIFP